jgi:hypothetical protein
VNPPLPERGIGKMRRKAMPSLTQEDIQKIVDSSIPEKLSLDKKPPITEDHVAHLLQLTQMGQTCLAADHLLFTELSGILPRIVSGVIQRLNILFVLSKPANDDTKESLNRKVNLRQYAYEFLIEMALNFYGLESRWLSEEEKSDCLSYILNLLEEWENLER